ncbi:DUF4253 domain-containing protein [Phytomonospora endophytica]|uniref:DUF4253 domain-containing protein n=1 Tax=Phytomonospora endophytica TaxID=714109 RepID=A0A841FS94_9ACTN|nr:DUF4253 domain-containing protein [Phytomonospora endophytica]MBB6039135.1 hypothetical protein [Phytomonospora endophytica]GIG67628.1 hypothetical protein Pen01_39230 [Phytomonospora endophytica]
MDLAEALTGLETPLPAGSLVTPEDGGAPVLWLSDRAADVDLWRRLADEHPRSGLCPLVLSELSWDDDEFRPWESGELYPGHMSSPAHADIATVLDVWWQRYAGPEEGGSVTAPYGPDWPGLAEGASFAPGAVDEAATRLATELLADKNRRIGLVAARTNAEALAAVGWSGPLNYENDTGLFCAVLADWRRRFGTTVVGAGFDTLWVSVAAPPKDLTEALPLAAELFAFCPDSVWQGAGTLDFLAERMVGAGTWRFWWD